MKQHIRLTSLSILMLIAFSAFSQLNGTYTIGSSGSYATFSAAVSDLNSLGVSGPVTFNVQAGTYNESVTMNKITGATASNTITFQSETGSAGDVELTYSNQTLILSSACYFYFRNLTITSTTESGSYNSCATANATIIIGGSTPCASSGGSDYDHFENCIINAPIAPWTDYSFAIWASYGSNDYIYVDGCTINGAGFGYEIEGSGTSYGPYLTNNTWNNQTYMAIDLAGANNCVIQGNTIQSSCVTSPQYSGPVTGSRFGIILWNGCYNMQIVDNKILNTMQFGMYIPTYGSYPSNILIANNFITGSYYGIYGLYSQGYSIYNNTFSTSYYGVDLGYDSYNNNILNNIFYCTGGTAITIDYTAYLNVCDYNDFYFTGTSSVGNLGGNGYAALTDWQNATGFDAHSQTMNPPFVSSTDFHLTDYTGWNFGTPLSQVTTDIDGNPRNPTNPDVGASEARGPILTGNRTPCTGSDVVYTSNTNQTNYVWIVTGTYSITAGGSSTDNTITINWSSPGTVSVTFDGAVSTTLANINAVNCTGISASLSTSANATCPTSNDGTVTLYATGGDGTNNYGAQVYGYSYNCSCYGWFGSGSSSNNNYITVTGVPWGYYNTAEVWDASNGQSDPYLFNSSITEADINYNFATCPTPISASYSSSANTDCPTSDNGMVILYATGGDGSSNYGAQVYGYSYECSCNNWFGSGSSSGSNYITVTGLPYGYYSQAKVWDLSIGQSDSYAFNSSISQANVGQTYGTCGGGTTISIGTPNYYNATCPSSNDAYITLNVSGGDGYSNYQAYANTNYGDYYCSPNPTSGGGITISGIPYYVTVNTIYVNDWDNGSVNSDGLGSSYSVGYSPFSYNNSTCSTPISASYSTSSNASCPSSSDGTITFSVSGGDGSYNYGGYVYGYSYQNGYWGNWGSVTSSSNGQVIIGGLPYGYYQYAYIYDNSNSGDGYAGNSPSVYWMYVNYNSGTCTGPISASYSTSSNASCPSSTDGTITFSVSGGDGSYNYGGYVYGYSYANGYWGNWGSVTSSSNGQVIIGGLPYGYYQYAYIYDNSNSGDGYAGYSSSVYWMYVNYNSGSCSSPISASYYTSSNASCPTSDDGTVVYSVSGGDGNNSFGGYVYGYSYDHGYSGNWGSVISYSGGYLTIGNVPYGYYQDAYIYDNSNSGDGLAATPYYYYAYVNYNSSACNTGPISASYSTSSNASCPSSSDGTITFSVSGGDGSYNYGGYVYGYSYANGYWGNWGTVTSSSNGQVIIGDLPYGYYQYAYIYDNSNSGDGYAGNSPSVYWMYVNYNSGTCTGPISASYSTSSNASCPSSTDGTITFSVSGGDGSYNYGGYVYGYSYANGYWGNWGSVTSSSNGQVIIGGLPYGYYQYAYIYDNSNSGDGYAGYSSSVYWMYVNYNSGSCSSPISASYYTSSNASCPTSDDGTVVYSVSGGDGNNSYGGYVYGYSYDHGYWGNWGSVTSYSGGYLTIGNVPYGYYQDAYIYDNSNSGDGLAATPYYYYAYVNYNSGTCTGPISASYSTSSNASCPSSSDGTITFSVSGGDGSYNYGGYVYGYSYANGYWGNWGSVTSSSNGQVIIGDLPYGYYQYAYIYDNSNSGDGYAGYSPSVYWMYVNYNSGSCVSSISINTPTYNNASCPSSYDASISLSVSGGDGNNNYYAYANTNYGNYYCSPNPTNSTNITISGLPYYATVYYIYVYDWDNGSVNSDGLGNSYYVGYSPFSYNSGTCSSTISAYASGGNVTADCKSDGYFTIYASGGDGSGYYYSVDNSYPTGDPVFGGMSLGNHTISVYDYDNWNTQYYSGYGDPYYYSFSYNVGSDGGYCPGTIQVNAYPANAVCPSSTDGSITILASGGDGTGNYYFAISGAQNQGAAGTSPHTFTGLVSGSYNITVYDASAIDQSQTVGNNGEGPWGTSGYSAFQPFTAGSTGLLTEIDFGITTRGLPPTTGSNLNGYGTLNVYSGSGTSGTLLSTQTVNVVYDYTRVSSPYYIAMQNFTLATPVSVTQGQTFTFQLIASSGLDNMWLATDYIGSGSSCELCWQYGCFTFGGDWVYNTHVAATSSAPTPDGYQGYGNTNVGYQGSFCPSPISFTISNVSPASDECPGTQNGSITVSNISGGGNPNQDYVALAWIGGYPFGHSSHGSGPLTISGLQSGNYDSVTVYDYNVSYDYYPTYGAYSDQQQTSQYNINVGSILPGCPIVAELSTYTSPSSPCDSNGSVTILAFYGDGSGNYVADAYLNGNLEGTGSVMGSSAGADITINNLPPGTEGAYVFKVYDASSPDGSDGLSTSFSPGNFGAPDVGVCPIQATVTPTDPVTCTDNGSIAITVTSGGYTVQNDYEVDYYASGTFNPFQGLYGPSLGRIQNVTLNTPVTFNNVPAGTYDVWTIDYYNGDYQDPTYDYYYSIYDGGASPTNGIVVNPGAPLTATITPSASACSGSTGNVYTTESGMINYSWVVIGGTPTAGGTGTDNTITVSWGAAAPGSVQVSYSDPTGACTANVTQPITINDCSSANNWIGGNNGNDWLTGSNWSTGSPPTNDCAASVTIPSGNSTNEPVVTGNVSIGNVTMGTGAEIMVNGNLSVCGSITGGGAGTTDAQILGTGDLILSGTSVQTISGDISFNNLVINSGTGGSVTLASNAKVDVYTALILGQGDINTAQGTLTFKSNSLTTSAIIDNFSSAAGNGQGTITGNITVERYYSTAALFGQHMIGTPVSGNNLSALGSANQSSAFITPTSNCDELHSASGTAYGNVFSYHESNGSVCTMAEWKVEAAGNATQNGLGYSVILTHPGSTFSLTGTANLTPSYSVNGLTNSNWNNFSLQTRHFISGWSLLSNPYLAPLSAEGLVSDNSANFDLGILVWDNTTGSYQAATTIAPFQAFLVHRSAPDNVGATYTINASNRVTTIATFSRQQNAEELNLVATNTSTGLKDATTVGFNANATNQFDPAYDFYKEPNDLSRHTLYTTSGPDKLWMMRNINRDINTTATVQVGLEPGVSGNYSFGFDGIASFDPTSYITLEDTKLHVMHDARSGNYNFTADATNDSWTRFVLHFTPPAQITTTDATCSETGMINIQQPGTANWNYALTDVNNTVLSSGTLNNNSLLAANVAPGVYTVTLTDNNGYTVVKNIQVNGDQALTASFTASAKTVEQNQNVILAATASSPFGGQGASFSWNFGDGTSATGATVTHNYLTAGVYTITMNAVNASGCTSQTTQSVTVTSRSATGVLTVSGSDKITIWSNTNLLYVDFTQLDEVQATIDVYNVLGQQMFSDKYTNSTVYRREIDNIEVGYIIVRVKNSDEIITKKVFITNDK